MNYLCYILLGYLLGSISPSAFISKVKKKDLRKSGTKNLGATNAMLVFGKGMGVLVMLIDTLKAIIAVKLAEYLFPEIVAAGILAGSFAVFGHIFPFYLKFKGGKGLASFAGMILALNPGLFAVMFPTAIIMIFVVNYCVAAPFTGAVMLILAYPTLTDDTLSIIMSIFVSILLAARHIPDIFRVRRGEDTKMRELLKEKLHK